MARIVLTGEKEESMRELSVRKHPRLKEYNYNKNGAYFITFCVEGAHEMLGKVVGRDAPGATFVELSEYGVLIHKEIEETHFHYKNQQKVGL